MDYDEEFPAPPQPTSQLDDSQATNSSKFAHSYVPSGQRPTTSFQSRNYANLVAKFRGHTIKKKPTTAKQNEAIARILDEPTLFTENSTPLFEYLYFNNKYRTKISSLRNDLRKLGIDTGRIIDIHYPGRGVIAMLMHVDYIPTLTAILQKLNKAPLTNYDQFSASHITTTEHQSLSIEQKCELAKQYQQTRLARALTHMRPQIKNTVATAFTSHGWLTDAQIKAALNSSGDSNTHQCTNNDFLKGFGKELTDEPMNTTSTNEPTPTPIDIEIDEEN